MLCTDLLPDRVLPLTPGKRLLSPGRLGMASSPSPAMDGRWLRVLLSIEPLGVVSRPLTMPPNLLLLAGMRWLSASSAGSQMSSDVLLFMLTDMPGCVFP